MAEVKISPGARLAAIGLLILVLIVGAANLVALRLSIDNQNRVQAQEQAAQRKQGEEIERKLCSTFAQLAANDPPPGNPATNPSRAYDQRNHSILAQVGPDLRCKP